jgi:hypothetical protein
MSLTELAAVITPILGRNGQLYRAAEPNYALAQAIRSGQLLNGGGSTGSVGTNATTGPTGVDMLAQPLQGDWLFSPNNPGTPQTTNFSLFGPTTTYPFTTEVFLEEWLNNNQMGSAGSHCSSTYVGAHTLITAAHCVFEGGNLFGKDMRFTPAATGSGGIPTIMPFGQFNNGNTSCYDWWFPGGWTTSCSNNLTKACSQYDFAAVDFRPCGNPTIAQTGWMGITVNETSFPSPIYSGGYPQAYQFSGSPPNPDIFPGPNPGCGPSQNPNNFYPFLCSTTESFASVSTFNNSWMISEVSDDPTGGISGGPVWQTQAAGACNPGPCVTGINQGEWIDTGSCPTGKCYYNAGRRIDTTVWNFLTQVTEL